MPVILQKLISRGLNKPDAEIIFGEHRTLIRGPSDTGKSYIRDCLWYLFGGDKVPKEIPQGKGYESLYLELKGLDIGVCSIKRPLLGGSADIYPVNIVESQNEEALPYDIGQFLVGLSGAKDKLLLRSLSKRGPMTGGDLRHWSLISQPAMISEESTTGSPTERTQRKAAFSTFLTGNDDSDFVLAQTKDEKIKLSTLITAIERDLERIKSELPENKNRAEIEAALFKVDGTLDLLSNQQVERSLLLRTIRKSINDVRCKLSDAESKLTQSLIMTSRFTLLDEKYISDLNRLRAVGDSVSVFEILPSQPCLLCNTLVEEQQSESLMATASAIKQRIAMEAEAKKIDELRRGLKFAFDREKESTLSLNAAIDALNSELHEISGQERIAIDNSVAEFSADPKKLAEARTEYFTQVSLFEEIDRLSVEHGRITKLIPTKKVKAVVRMADVDAVKVGVIIKGLLRSWGFTQLKTVELAASECDINIDGRPRLSYGAGKRAIFLSAMSVGLMTYALQKKHPHLGVVVLDSPIKSYSDPDNVSDVTVSPVIVRESFYEWLSKWEGPGQVVVLENEPIQDSTAIRLKPIVFTGLALEGRTGFYPKGNDVL